MSGISEQVLNAIFISLFNFKYQELEQRCPLFLLTLEIVISLFTFGVFIRSDQIYISCISLYVSLLSSGQVSGDY